MKQANTLKPVRSKDEAREILFMDSPNVRELFDTIEATPKRDLYGRRISRLF